ncbi:MAG: hypothetical protein JJU11_06690 [Candidatus Sumerlaeia bacterium]|nr:hypothetical protein [Candidatus Sumerlaeia bacterium]
MKLQTTLFCSLAAAALAMVSVAGAQTVILEDDFESYSDNTAVLAAAHWDGMTNAELSTEEAASGTNSIKIPLNPAGSLLGGHTPVLPSEISETDPLVVSYAYFDADATAGGPLRTGLSYGHFTGGTWGAGTFDNFFALGIHSPDSTTHYTGRVVDGGAGWSVFNEVGSEIPRATGWREMSMVIRPDNIEFYVDGQLGATDNYDAVTEFNSMRLGQFAGTSNTIDVYMDDLKIQIGLDPVASVTDWHLN